MGFEKILHREKEREKQTVSLSQQQLPRQSLPSDASKQHAATARKIYSREEVKVHAMHY